MNNFSNMVQVLPIPWMKQKLESIYSTNLYGNLFLMYNNSDSKYLTNLSTYDIYNFLDDNNIFIDELNPLYLYIPLEVDDFTKNLLITFKELLKENIYIILGGYKENYPNLSELDCVVNLYEKFPELKNIVNFVYLIDTSKSYEIFTSLSDTQRIFINPPSSCTISGITLNYHIKQLNPNNSIHISFVNLLDHSSTDNFVSYYLKGLTNNNNNFNFNF